MTISLHTFQKHLLKKYKLLLVGKLMSVKSNIFHSNTLGMANTEDEYMFLCGECDRQFKEKRASKHIFHIFVIQYKRSGR